MADNRGSWLTTATALFLTWATLAFVVRAWAKLRTKNWGLDDYFMTAALALGVIHVACILRAIQEGYGLSLSEIPDLYQVQVALYTSQLFYVFTVGLSRISATLFLAYMAHSGPHKKLANALTVGSVMWTVASGFAVAFRGSVHQPWAVMDGSKAMFARWIGIEVSGLLIELALWVGSLHLILSLNLQKRKRIFVLGAFGVRLFLIPIIICRIVYLSPQRNPDPTYSSIVPSILAEGGLQFSIVSASVTCFRPFLQALHPVCPAKSLSTAASSQSGTRTPDVYYRLEAFRKSSSDPLAPKEAVNWQPFHGEGQGFAMAYPANVHTRSKSRSRSRLGHLATHSRSALRLLSDDESERSHVQDDMIIQRTTEVSVQFEDVPGARTNGSLN